MVDVIHQVNIGVSPAKVFAALTEAEGMRKWWSEHSTIEPEVGSLASVSFYNNAVTFKLRISELVPQKLVVWNVEGGPPYWSDTKIKWALTEDKGKTVLDFNHSSFDLDTCNFGSLNYNWAWYATSLKFYLEKGEGMPHTDADLL